MEQLPLRERTFSFFRTPYRMPVKPFQAGLSLILLLTLFLAACGRSGTPPVPTPEETYVVDPVFQPLYERLGGHATLGPAISPRFQGNGQDYQYTVAALLVYDPRLPATGRLHLAPLGRELGVEEGPVSTAEGEAQPFADYLVYPDFAAVYEKLGGETVAGRPLGAARRNAELNRIEQYFDNLGLYRLEADPTGTVGLLAYGAWKCDLSCRYSPPLNSALMLPRKRALAFVQIVQRFGVGFTGLALTDPYLAPDGNLEQIYENLVLATDPQDTTRVFLRPVPGKLGVMPGPLASGSSQPGMQLIPIQGEAGYFIPQEFLDYLGAHGGLDLSGPPITQLEQLDATTLRQCFLNLCLEGDSPAVGPETTQPAPPGASQPGAVSRVRPSALGVTYRELFYQAALPKPETELAGELSVQLWEGYPLVASDQEQEIGVVVLSNNAPLPNVSPVLTLTRPDGELETFILEPTSQTGETRITIPPVAAQNGTLVPYQVCIAAQDSRKFCVLDSYLIWEADYETITPRVPPQHTLYFPFIFKEVKVYFPLIFKTFTVYLPIGLKNRSGD